MRATKPVSANKPAGVNKPVVGNKPVSESKPASTDTPRSRWWDVLLLIVGALLAAGGSFFATTVQTWEQAKVQKEGDQRKAFVRLVGMKLVREQLNVSRFEALVYSDYHEERWRRAGFPKDALDLQEAQRMSDGVADCRSPR